MGPEYVLLSENRNNRRIVLLSFLEELIPYWDYAEKLIKVLRYGEISDTLIQKLLKIIDIETRSITNREAQEKLNSIKNILIDMRRQEKIDKEKEMIGLEEILTFSL